MNIKIKEINVICYNDPFEKLRKAWPWVDTVGIHVNKFNLLSIYQAILYCTYKGRKEGKWWHVNGFKFSPYKDSMKMPNFNKHFKEIK